MSPEIFSSSPIKINVRLKTSKTFSLSPQLNQPDEMEGINTPLGSGGDDNDSKVVSNEEDNVYADQREHIKLTMSSYDDADSEDCQIDSESEDEIIENMEQVAAGMKSDVELDKTAEDTNEFVCIYIHILFITSIGSYEYH